MKSFEIIATTLFGLEEVLANELTGLGVTDIELANRAVRFRGDLATMYACNLLCRTALRILRPVHQFEAGNEQELYQGIREVSWDQYMSYKQTFAIDGISNEGVVTHSKYLALKSKDAIADQFRDKYTIRPSVDTEKPDLKIVVHMAGRNVYVALDSSGVGLGKRNYRLAQSEAPINEVLAAGILLLTGWDREKDLIDPMCGSGTFPIEAAFLAANIPPGRNRSFGFQTWNDYQPGLWEEIKRAAEAEIRPPVGKIFATDINPRVLDVARANADRAGVRSLIRFHAIDFFQSARAEGNGLLVINPPYGERMPIQEIGGFYQDMGTRLKHFFPGCDAWMISANLEALKQVGLKPSRKIKLFNGSLECRLHKYQLYPGSKKTGAVQT